MRTLGRIIGDIPRDRIRKQDIRSIRGIQMDGRDGPESWRDRVNSRLRKKSQKMENQTASGHLDSLPNVPPNAKVEQAHRRKNAERCKEKKKRKHIRIKSKP
jgi:hypothetical protein